MVKKLKYIFILLILMIIFRGYIYRSLVKYQSSGERLEIDLTDTELMEIIDREVGNRGIGISEIIDLSNEITSKKLNFSFSKVSNDPNILIESEKANCVGYSSMFNSVLNYMILKNGLNGEIKAEHKIGKLFVIGYAIHQIIDNPFFKDHDYNTITEMSTGKTIVVDPTVTDYLLISRVAEKEE